MTESTAEPAPTVAPATPTSSDQVPAVRPARRSPTELTFHLDRASVERLAAAEPDWLAADRLAALELVRTAPLEPNPLFTPYLDLRAAELEAVRPYEAVLEGPDAGTSTTLDEGVAAVLEVCEDRITRLAVAPEAAAVGLEIVTLSDLARRDDSAARRVIEGSILPADDRFAQITRAGWNEALVVRLPDGARIEQPLLLRWAVGAPGRAVIVRVFVELGAGAAASVVEELVPSGPVGAGAGQAFFATTTEVVLGAAASLAWASIGELGPNVVAVQHRTDRLGEGAELH
ncbi:MAG: hypothetical protein K6T92_07670, partial [Candidatus Rokubacteria bacterium]|nr:hypothetical protein [Candidatus Rokubacteria bacterium]